jgi:uracil-DNA glycosylase family 4
VLCVDCTLARPGIRPVEGCGDPSSPIWLVGEAPGANENHEGMPFIGRSGQELDNYLYRAGINRPSCYVTNLIKCHPQDDRDPKPAEIAECSKYLEMELALAPGNVTIAAVGKFATRYFLGPDADMATLHGIPQRDPAGRAVVPCYHPAYGMRNTTEMTHIHNDFQMFGRVVHSEITPEDWVDPYPDTHYREATVDDLQVLLDMAADRQATPFLIGVDTETSGPWQTTQISAAPGTGLCIHADTLLHNTLLKELLEHPNVMVVFHYALHDLGVLLRRDIHPRYYVDTMVMAYLLQDLPQGLKPLAYRVCRMPMEDYSDLVAPFAKSKTKEYLEVVDCFEDWPTPDPVLMMVKDQLKVRQPQGVNRRVKNILRDMAKGTADPEERWFKLEDSTRKMIEDRLGPWEPGYLSDLPREKALWYSNRDADATLRTYLALVERIEQEGLWGVMEVDLAISPMILEMMQRGMGVDLPHFAHLRHDLERRMWAIEGDMRKQLGFPINPASSDQVRHLLFKHLKLKPPKLTKKGDKESTDHAVLEELRGEHPAVDHIVEYREANKLVGTFIDVLSAKASNASDGRVHATISTTRVVTGRLACKNPNLLAIPVRSELGRRLRDGFVAREGCSLVANDYSQIEMRLCAHVSQDPVMMDIFLRGADIHAETASSMFGIPLDQLDEMQHRYPAKRVGFGVLYYIGPKSLRRELYVGGAGWWSENLCEELITKWFKKYAGVKHFMEHTRAYARRHQEVRDMFGRKRLVPEVLSVHGWIREAGLRQAANAPIQMGAQGIIKRAMRDLVPIVTEFQEAGYTFNPLIQIHDDLMFEISDEIIPIAVSVIKDVMENAVKLSIPVRVDTKIGKTWGSMAKYKEV